MACKCYSSISQRLQKRPERTSKVLCCSSRIGSLVLSKLCLGTMQFGERLDLSDSTALLNCAKDSGVTFFDTAEMYPVPQRAETQGLSETFLGRWLKNQPRDNVTISTKIAGPSGQMTWIRGGPHALNSHNIREAVHGSLQRLGTDYVDLLTLHWPDRYVPMFGDSEYEPGLAYSACSFEEQIEALTQLHQDGKIRELVVSNETPFGLMRFCEVARLSGAQKVAAIQNAYSLVCRTFDAGLAECCHQENVGLLAYSPLAMGLLTGKYRKGRSVPSDARLIMYKGRYAEAESRYGPKPNLAEAVEAYCNLAEQASLQPFELALRFVLGRPLVASAVIGATSLIQLQGLIDASHQGPLPADVLAEIELIHQRYPNPAP